MANVAPKEMHVSKFKSRFLAPSRPLIAALALGVAATVGMSSGAMAASFEDGVQRYLQGDYSNALKIWQPLADDGDAIALFNIGVLHAQGLGVPVDQAKAVGLYRQAAERGYAPAQFNLGAAYRNGHGVAQNDTEAANWWQHAADQGEVQAQYNLGMLYLQGLGVSRDDNTARYFFEQAARRGDQRAQQALVKLGGAGGSASAVASASSTGAAKNVKTDSGNDDTIQPQAETVVQSTAAAAQTVADTASSAVTSVAETVTAASETVTSAVSSDSSTTVIAQAAAPQPVPEPEPVAESAPAPVAQTQPAPVINPSVGGEEWVMSNDPAGFTVQVYASGDPAAAQKYIERYNLGGQARAFQAISGSKVWYKVVYGAFASSAEAKAARSQLPVAIQKNSPWVRRFSRVQSEVDTTALASAGTVVAAATPAPAPQPVVQAPAPVEVVSEKDPTVPEVVPEVTTTTVVAADTVESSASNGNTTTASIVAADSSGNYTSVVVPEPAAQPQVNENAPAPPANTTEVAVAAPAQTMTNNDIANPSIAFSAGQRAFNQQDYATALQYWQPLAQNGHAEAQYGLGFMNETGWGVTRNATEAMTWYKQAAEQGYAKAQYNLGMMYLLGNGVPADESMGLYWIQSAADQNDLRARAQLSRLRTSKAN